MNSMETIIVTIEAGKKAGKKYGMSSVFRYAPSHTAAEFLNQLDELGYEVKEKSLDCE